VEEEEEEEEEEEGGEGEGEGERVTEEGERVETGMSCLVLGRMLAAPGAPLSCPSSPLVPVSLARRDYDVPPYGAPAAHRAQPESLWMHAQPQAQAQSQGQVSLAGAEGEVGGGVRGSAWSLQDMLGEPVQDLSLPASPRAPSQSELTALDLQLQQREREQQEERERHEGQRQEGGGSVGGRGRGWEGRQGWGLLQGLRAVRHPEGRQQSPLQGPLPLE